MKSHVTSMLYICIYNLWISVHIGRTERSNKSNTFPLTNPKLVLQKWSKHKVTGKTHPTQADREINGDQTHLGLRLDGSKLARLISWIFFPELLRPCPVVFWLGRLSRDFPLASLSLEALFCSDDRETDVALSSSSSSSPSPPSSP